MMSSDNASFDDMYIQIASRAGNIDNLLSSFFGFLHRKTDFYVEIPDNYKSKMGFPPNVAQHKMLNAFKHYPMKTPEKKDMQLITQSKKSVSSTSSKVVQPKGSDLSPPHVPDTKPVPPVKPTPALAPVASSVQLTSQGKQVPIGNGGICDNYYWTQTLQEVNVYIGMSQYGAVLCDI